MRTDLLKRTTLNGGESINFKVSKGHVNGLVLFCSSRAEELKITVRRRAQHQTFLLANQLLHADIVRISEMDSGYAEGASYYARVLQNALAAGGTPIASGAQSTALDAYVEGFTGQRGLTYSYLDFGSMFLNGENELDITIQSPAAYPAMSLGLYTVSHTKRPDFMKAYDAVLDFDTQHHNVESIYFVSGGAKAMVDRNEGTGALTESAAVFTIRDDEDVVVLDAVGAYGASLLFGQNQALSDQRITRIFKRRDPLPADVYVKVAGVLPVIGTATGVYLVVVRDLYDVAVTSANTISEADSLALRIGELEKRDPQTAQALRHAGLIVKSSQLAAAVASVS